MSQHHSSANGGPALDGVMEKLLERGFSELENTEANADEYEGKTKKVFGVLEVPANAATIIQSVWNEGSQMFTDWFGEHSYKFYQDAGRSFGVRGKMLVQGATVATFSTNILLRSWPTLEKIFGAMDDQQKEQKEMARKIAPVLQEVRGSHSAGALMSTTAEQNEMLFVARKRMAMHADTNNVNATIDFVVNNLPGIFTDMPKVGRMWNGNRSPVAVVDPNNPLTRMAGMVSRMGVSPLASVLTNSNTRNLRKKFSSPYSALDMVIGLEAQVEHNPKAHGFQLPGQHGESVSLEEYIGRIMIRHQKDMVDLTHDHTELRVALKSDIAEVAKPLAEAIRSGDMSAMSLIRLIGEGKIIKNKGRAICSPEDIEGMIERGKPQAHKYTTVDSKEFYANTTFKKDELSQALKNLEGQDKQMFAAMFPDSILEEAGMHKDDVLKMREAMGQHYEHHLAEAVLGAASMSDEELKKQGLATREIKQLRQAGADLAQRGEHAMHDLKSGPTNADGIERAMLNLAVPRVNGDKSYFGTLLSKGREEVKKLPQISAEEAAAQGPKAHGEQADEADLEGSGFADREDERRAGHDEPAQGY